MTNVRMKAVDTLHVSGVGPDNILPGAEFTVPSAVADDLEKRGLADRLGEAKAEPAPENKMEAEPENKAVKAPISAKRVKKGA
jgi:hypothetical protein